MRTDTNYLKGKKVRHVKRGTEYEILGIALGQDSTIASYPTIENEDLVIYKCLDYGFMYARHLDEFLDGRFIVVDQTTDSKEIKE